MAALVHSMDAPSLIVSAAHMDVHSLAAVYSTFLATFKLGAAEPDVAIATSEQIKRLEKMALVRQQCRRQLRVIAGLYGPPNEDGATVEALLGGGKLAARHGGEKTREECELRTLHEMAQQLSKSMAGILSHKHRLAPRKLWPCVTLDEIFRQLNGVKTRLLGKGCEPFETPEPPKALIDAAAALGDGSGAAHADKGKGIAMHGSMMGKGGILTQIKRMASDVAAGIPFLTSQEDDDELAEQERYKLHVTVKMAKSLRDGGGKVYARVKARGGKYYTPHVRRTQTQVRAHARVHSRRAAHARPRAHLGRVIVSPARIADPAHAHERAQHGVEVPSFRQQQPFVFGSKPPHLLVSDDDDVEVYLWEDGVGPDTPLGRAEVRRSPSCARARATRAPLSRRSRAPLSAGAVREAARLPRGAGRLVRAQQGPEASGQGLPALAPRAGVVVVGCGRRSSPGVGARLGPARDGPFRDVGPVARLLLAASGRHPPARRPHAPRRRRGASLLRSRSRCPAGARVGPRTAGQRDGADLRAGGRPAQAAPEDCGHGCRRARRVGVARGPAVH